MVTGESYAAQMKDGIMVIWLGKVYWPVRHWVFRQYTEIIALSLAPLFPYTLPVPKCVAQTAQIKVGKSISNRDGELTFCLLGKAGICYFPFTASQHTQWLLFASCSNE